MQLTALRKKRIFFRAKQRGLLCSFILLILLSFVSTSSSAQIDTENWFLRASTPSPLLFSVTRGNDIFVTVGEGILDSGNGYWSHSGTGVIMVSADGGSWVDLPGAASLPVLRGVVSGAVEEEELYVIVGDSRVVLTSTDGLSWTQGELPSDIRPKGVAFGNDTFVSVGDSGILTSTDGGTWSISLPGGTQPTALFSYLKSVIFDGTNFVAVGSVPTGIYGVYSARILISSDGVSWTDVSPSPVVTSELRSVTYGNGVWLAVGGYLDGNWYKSTVFRSTDGLTWVPGTPPPVSDMCNAVAYSGSDFVLAFGSSGSSTLYRSQDGLSWTSVTLPNGTISGFNGRSFAAGSDTLVGVGEGGPTAVGMIQSSNSLGSRRGGARDNPYTFFDTDGQPPSRVGLPVYHVNTASLNLVLEGSLFFMKTKGAPLDLRLTFNSSPGTPQGMFGQGWWFAYEAGLTIGKSTAKLMSRGGKPLVYTASEKLADATPTHPVVLTAPVGIFDRLTSYGDYWLFEEKKTRRTYRFTPGTPADVAYLSAIIDQNGNSVNFEVDAVSGQIQAISDPANRRIEFTYTGSFCTKIQIPDGRTVLFRYDGSGNLIGITDMNGHIASYGYNAEGFMTQMTVEGRVTSFSYFPRPGFDGDFCIGSVTDPLSNITRYEFLPGSSNRVTRTDASGVSVELTARDGNTAEFLDPLAQISSIKYVNGLPDTFVNANGRKSYFTYDIRGNLTEYQDPLYNRTTFTFDANDLMTERTDPLANSWRYNYDTARNLTIVTSPLGNTTTFSYDSFGQLLTVVDDAGHTSSFVNDDYGNITRITDQLGNATNFTFDGFGLRCIQLTDARSHVKTMEYDGNDRLTRKIYHLPDGETLDLVNTYDAFGQTSITDEKGRTTTFQRNMLGFITEVTDALGQISVFEYDAANNMVKNIDPLGRVAESTYDSADRLTGHTDSLGNNLIRSYDDEGNLLELTNRRGKITTFTYDSANRLKSIRYPSSPTSITYSRDKNGRVSTMTNGRGTAIAFLYDADGRMTEKQYNTIKQVAYSYDSIGNLTGLTDSTGTTTYQYDARKQVTGISYPDGKQVSFSYDAVGNLTRLVYPDGTIVDNTYDPLNRIRPPRSLRNAVNSEVSGLPEKRNQVTSATWPDGSIALSYDATANITAENRANGVTTEYAYNAGDRIITISHKLGNVVYASFEYTYDGNGNCTAEKTLGVLQPPPTDAVGSAVYNDMDQITSWGPNSYSYDADGNLTAISGVFTATYDVENRLASMTRNSTDTVFYYDGNGERVRSVRGAVTTRYYYDRRGRLLCEADETGAVTANYIYAGARLVARGTHAGGYHYYHFDRNGSTIALTDAAGSVAARYAYTPYGAKRLDGNDGGNPFSYVGAYGVLDEGDGLYLMKNRFYDAVTARFLQRDPIGYDGGFNLYAYVGGNPVNRIDPKGTGWLGWFDNARKFFNGVDDALAKKKARDANIAKKGFLRAAEDGDITNDIEARGKDAVKFGKDGAKLGFDAGINMATSGVNAVVGRGIPGSLILSTAVDKFEKSGSGGNKEDGQQDTSLASPSPDNSDTSSQQVEIEHVEEIDWSKIEDPSTGSL